MTTRRRVAAGLVPVLAASAAIAAAAASFDVARPAAPVLAALFGSGCVAAAILDSAGRARRESTRLRRHDEDSRSQAVLHDRAVVLDRLLDGVREGVVVVAADGRITVANRAARSLLALGARGTSPAVEALGLVPLAQETIRGQKGAALERELHFPTRRILSIEAAPFDEGALVLLADVTTARHADEVRRDFVANVSHELKTPVAGIALLAEQLAHAVREDPTAARRFAERIERETQRLGELVNDLLDLSRAESSLPLTVTTLDAVLLADDALERVSALATAKSIDVVVVDRPESAPFPGDPTLAAAALANLLDNAVRYSPPRSQVRLRIRLTGDRVEFVVEDDGLGIPSDEIGRIFERFYRVDKARARATGGTGLGLAIVKHAAERHGGTVSAVSELGRGSQFTLTFPAGGAR